MAQATFSIRMDEQLKNEFDKTCAAMGMTATTAFNIYAKTVVRERRIPFELRADGDRPTLQEGLEAFRAMRTEAKNAGVQDLTLDEINAEINAARNDGVKRTNK